MRKILFYLATGLGLGCGVAAIFFVFCDSDLAQILVQLGGALLVAATLFYQYFTSREEFKNYHTDRLRESFQHYMTNHSEAVASLKMNALFGEEMLHSMDVVTDLVKRYDSICKVLSAEDDRYFSEEYREKLEEKEEYEIQRQSQLSGTGIDRSLYEAVSIAEAQVKEYHQVARVCFVYDITKKMWEEFRQQDEQQIALRAISILLQHHQDLLNRLLFAYITLDTFFRQYSANAVVQEEGAAFLLSKFRGDELRFFFLWAEYNKAIGQPLPSKLYSLLKEAGAKYPIA